ncbi:MAG: alpha/beta fold hydrolase [Anaerofustis stercorihominis]|nr:alpha/beta fold hydrolase [Anaerofustis stercorihominis]
MKKFLCIILIMLMFMPLFSCGDSSQTDFRVLADEYMADFVAGDYEKMMEYEMTPIIASQMSVEMIKQIKEETLPSQYGDYLGEYSFSEIVESSGMNLYCYVFSYDTADVTIAVGINNKGQIASFVILDVKSKVSIDFSENVKETPVTFGNDPYIISGSVISSSDENSPAVVILAGSGASDRYGRVGANAIYANIADNLAKQGIKVLIFDKRTFTYGTEISTKEDMSIYDEYLYDAKDAVEFMKNYPGVERDKVYVLGHSLGAYILGMVNEYLVQDVAGYIFLCPPSDSMHELMIYQLEYLAGLDGEISKEEQMNIALYEAQADNIKNLTEENKSEYNSAVLLNAPASYWLSMKNYDPALSAEAIKSEMFLAFGGRDYQVPISQKKAWYDSLGGRSDVIINVYENMNHMLFDYTGTPSPDEYNIKSEINSQLIDDIVDFIEK